MKEKKENIIHNFERKRFSNKFKRRVLLEVANGKTPKEAFSVLGYSESSTDKKYCAKLIHKWKQEMYKNRNILFASYENINYDDFKFEIESTGSDSENDELEKQITNNFSTSN